ncbi:hypothetical protein EC844_11397 [Acinetobacter calcoaceticus]|uniref:Uncharacterized protein n=1 Tax=Acinetobacter calcoaceticus TaxID=471 RepID=A0A4R1XQF1_ACICA|nr:hypothetical protein EC844_11397 [Acinetobacter calcoaceticus]
MNYIYITASFYLMLLLLVMVGQSVQALPLLNTDDAQIVDPQHCQLEIGQQFYQGQHTELAVTPACNIMGAFELGIPLSVDAGQSSYAVQVKKTLFSAEDRFAIAASAHWQPNQQHHGQGWQFNLPLTVSAIAGWQFDANLGFNHESKEDETTWGVASSYEFNPSHQMSMELFKNQPGRPRAQAVYHYNVVPDNLSLHAAYGYPLKSEDKPWVGVGMSWVMATR